MEIMNSFIELLQYFKCIRMPAGNVLQEVQFAERGSQQHLVDSGIKTLEASQTPLWGYK